MLVALGLGGLTTVPLGRIAGDTGVVGGLLGGEQLVVFGLCLLDLVRLPWLMARLRQPAGTLRGPSVIGFLLGARLGLCTFAFLAPALGVAVLLAQKQPILSAGIIAAAASTHVGIVVLAGTFGSATATWHRSRGAGQLVVVLR